MGGGGGGGGGVQVVLPPFPQKISNKTSKLLTPPPLCKKIPLDLPLACDIVACDICTCYTEVKLQLLMSWR